MPRKNDGQAPQPVEVDARSEWRETLPMAIRALDPGGGSGPFRGWGPGLADACCCPARRGRGRLLAPLLVRALCGGRRAGRSR